MRIIIKYILLPLSWIYGLAVNIRNLLFDLKISKSYSFKIPVIGIGNLSTGGTGKTPMTEYILELLLEQGYKPAMLSRGYGRNSKGYMQVETTTTASEAGDEPVQVKRKFPEVLVTVSESRVKGVKAIMATQPEINVIVLDDCFQHRKIKAGLNILLSDFKRPFYKDKLIPVGTLREPRSGMSRADIIVVTKCPVLPDQKSKSLISSRINLHERQDLFFTSIEYFSLIKAVPDHNEKDILDMDSIKGYKVLLFTGIAKRKPILDYLTGQGVYLLRIRFPDHHIFTEQDIHKILKRWKKVTHEKKLILTTEKDWRRLENTAFANEFTGLPLYYLPIKPGWSTDEKQRFDQKIISYVQAN